MNMENVIVGKTYAINENNESNFRIGELVEVIAKGHINPNWILVRTHNPETTAVATSAGHGTQVVEAEELSELE